MHLIPDALKGRELVSVKSAARAAGVDQRTLLKRISESRIPIISLGPRKRALRVSDFDRLIAAHQRGVSDDFSWLASLSAAAA